MPKPKIITICGSSRFVDIMAVVAWILEKEEDAIVLSLHLLPEWYTNIENIPDHLAEHEGVADKMDALHLRKIELSDEIFVVDPRGYIGESTKNEIDYALKNSKPIRYFTVDDIGLKVGNIIQEFLNNKETTNETK